MLGELDKKNDYLESIDIGEDNLEIRLENLKKNDWKRMGTSAAGEGDNRLGLVHMGFDCSIHDIYDPDFTDKDSQSDQDNSKAGFYSVSNDEEENDIESQTGKKRCDRLNRSLNESQLDKLNPRTQKKCRVIPKRAFSYDDNIEYDRIRHGKQISNSGVTGLYNRIKGMFSDFYDIEFIDQVWNTRHFVGNCENMEGENYMTQASTQSETLGCGLSIIEANSTKNSLNNDSILGILESLPQMQKEAFSEKKEKKFRKRKGISATNSIGGNLSLADEHDMLINHDKLEQEPIQGFMKKDTKELVWEEVVGLTEENKIMEQTGRETTRWQVDKLEIKELLEVQPVEVIQPVEKFSLKIRESINQISQSNINKGFKLRNYNRGESGSLKNPPNTQEFFSSEKKKSRLLFSNVKQSNGLGLLENLDVKQFIDRDGTLKELNPDKEVKVEVANCYIKSGFSFQKKKENKKSELPSVKVQSKFQKAITQGSNRKEKRSKEPGKRHLRLKLKLNKNSKKNSKELQKILEMRKKLGPAKTKDEDWRKLKLKTTDNTGFQSDRNLSLQKSRLLTRDALLRVEVEQSSQGNLTE